VTYRLRTEISWSETLAALGETMRKWGVREWSVTPATMSSKIARKVFQTMEERTVTLRYLKNGAEVVLAMSKQDRAVDNLRVLYLAIEAMRLNEARGIADVIREAYLQLPSPSQHSDPYEVLGVRPDSPIEVIEAAYRARAKMIHPDKGGSEEEMRSLNEAMEIIRRQQG
jgi:DnaJ-domain-containing protein 1